jgi:hypothetical protein
MVFVSMTVYIAKNYLRGHFTGKFDSHEIAAVKYQITAKNSVAASAQSATG